MPHERKRKRTRSRSRDRRRSRDETKEKLENLQTQLNNLTSILGQLTQRPDITENKEILDSQTVSSVEQIPSEHIENSSVDEITDESVIPEDILDLLGDDPNANKELTIKFHPELKRRWEKWMQEGFPEENKKAILQKYPRKQELYSEAPKVNLEIVPILSEITIKRDHHFLETQNCVDSAISALAAAVSLILDDPDDGIDQGMLTKYLCDAGKLLSDVFYQQSVARKSFITPLLNKGVKPTIEATTSDEWLYGNKFAEQVKEVQAIGKACAKIRAQDKPKVSTYKSRNQGNLKYPPARYRQVGTYPRRSTIKFKPRSQRTSQGASKPSSRTSSQSTSTKK
ncbi:uncharacterized protein LOC115233213 [Formica exsecta]|nr:uncharacterized protein LOC115233213 [Formica exsecta]XP_029659378.1 uncharacterized protein LOC115233213 [Formica exsecta]